MLCMDLWWFMDFRDINDIKPLFYGSNSRGSWKSSPPSLAAAKMEPVLLPYTLGIKLGKRKSIFWLENMRKSPIHGGSMKILHKLDSPLPCLTGRGYIIYENRASTNNNGAMIQQCVCVEWYGTSMEPLLTTNIPNLTDTPPAKTPRLQDVTAKKTFSHLMQSVFKANIDKIHSNGTNSRWLQQDASAITYYRMGPPR